MQEVTTGEAFWCCCCVPPTANCELIPGYGPLVKWEVSDNADGATLIIRCNNNTGSTYEEIPLDLSSGRTGTVAYNPQCYYTVEAYNDCGTVQSECLNDCNPGCTDPRIPRGVMYEVSGTSGLITEDYYDIYGDVYARVQRELVGDGWDHSRFLPFDALECNFIELPEIVIGYAQLRIRYWGYKDYAIRNGLTSCNTPVLAGATYDCTQGPYELTSKMERTTNPAGIPLCNGSPTLIFDPYRRGPQNNCLNFPFAGLCGLENAFEQVLFDYEPVFSHKVVTGHEPFLFTPGPRICVTPCGTMKFSTGVYVPELEFPGNGTIRTWPVYD